MPFIKIRWTIIVEKKQKFNLSSMIKERYVNFVNKELVVVA